MNFRGPVLILSAAVMAGASVTLEKKESAFHLGLLQGKRLVCIDSAVTGTGRTIPDLDGIYASKVFQKAYPDPRKYTTPLLDKVCGELGDRLHAVPFAQPGPDSAGADFRLTLQSVVFHHRLQIKTVYAIRDMRTDRIVAEFAIEAEDPFGFGGDSRFQEAMGKLASATLSELRAKFAVLASKDDKTYSRKALYLELGGAGIIYSANFEYRARRSLALRIGYEFFKAPRSSGPAHFIISRVSYLAGSGSHLLELGAGPTLDFSPDNGLLLLYGGSLCYRYQPNVIPSGAFFRFGFTPTIGPVKDEDGATHNEFLPFPGLSFGFSF